MVRQAPRGKQTAGLRGGRKVGVSWGYVPLGGCLDWTYPVRASCESSTTMLIDIRYDLMSMFLLWGALVLTLTTCVALVVGSPRARVQFSGAAAVILWAAGTMVPMLS